MVKKYLSTILNNRRSLIFIDQAIVSGSNFLLGIFLARVLGVETYGTFSLLWLIVLFLSSMQLAFVISPMLTLGSNKQGKVKDVFLSSMFYLQLIFASVIVGLLLGFFEVAILFNSKWEVGSSKYYLLLVAFSFLVQDFVRRYFIMQLKYFDLIIMDTIAYLGQFIILGCFFYLDELSLSRVFLSIFSAFGAAMIFGILKMNHLHLRPGYLKLVLIRNWKFSRWLVYSAALQWGSGNYFILAAGTILGNWAVGAIRIAQNIMGVLHVVFLSLENILPITFAEVYRKDGLKSLAQYFKKYIYRGCVFFIVLFLLIYPFSTRIVSFLYGPLYTEYAYLIGWFLFIYLFIYQGMLLRYVLRTLDETKVIFYGYVVNLAFSLIASSFLINKLGLSGVVIGMIVIQILQNLIMFFKIEKLKRVPL